MRWPPARPVEVRPADARGPGRHRPAAASDKLRLDGLHLHIGSQILSAEPYARAVEAVAGLGEFSAYNLGGGLGVRYTYADDPPSPEDWIGALAAAARRSCRRAPSSSSSRAAAWSPRSG